MQQPSTNSVFSSCTPDNWLLQGVDSDEACDSVTLEMPRGRFLHVTKYREVQIWTMCSIERRCDARGVSELECEPADVDEGDAKRENCGSTIWIC